VVILVAISLAIITVDYRAGDAGPLAAAGRAVSSAIAPLQDAVSSVVRPIGDFFSSLARLPSLAERNEELQAQVDDLKTAHQVNQELRRRLDSLRNLLGLQTTIQRSVAASVIASGVSNFEWTVTIDRGSDDGIEVDMPVIAGTSGEPRLVGRVLRVTPISADVQLLIDRDFAVAGRLSTSNETGLVEGRGEDDLRMDLLSPGVEVPETEPESVFTVSYRVNGQRGLYPPGLLIGTVSRAYSEPDSVESYVTIRPAVDFSTLEFVLVLTRGRSEEGSTP
jgi:rod shape-determining protein MreC